MPGTKVPLGWVAIFELRCRDESQFLSSGIGMGLDFCHLLPSGIKIGIDFQTLVPSWYIDGCNFCFEARYKSNQDFGPPVVPPPLP